MEEDDLFQVYFDNAMTKWNANDDQAKAYAGYRLDGYSSWQSRVMSGLADPVE